MYAYKLDFILFYQVKHNSSNSEVLFLVVCVIVKTTLSRSELFVPVSRSEVKTQ
jgi:hypothetical protein